MLYALCTSVCVLVVVRTVRLCCVECVLCIIYTPEKERVYERM